jgi:hypothetical protein
MPIDIAAQYLKYGSAEPSSRVRASFANALALAASPASHSVVLRMSFAVASSGFSAGAEASRSRRSASARVSSFLPAAAAAWP